MSKRLRTVLVTLLLMLAMSVNIFAAEVTTPGSSGTTEVTLNAEATDFSVTLPLQLPVELLANGTVVCANSGTAVITNNSPLGGAVITDVTVSGLNGYALGEYTDNWAAKKVNTKAFGFQLNTENVNAADGKIVKSAINWPVITAGGGTLPINYDAKLSAQNTALSDVIVGQVVFVAGWDLAE